MIKQGKPLVGVLLTKGDKDGTEHGRLSRVSGSLHGQVRNRNESYSTGDCKHAHADVGYILRVQAAYPSCPNK